MNCTEFLTIFANDMIDYILLFPYWLALKIRDARYKRNKDKAVRTEVPSVCVGNITVGGTGKTPHVEMILRLLLGSDEWGLKNIAVVSRGYKRRTKGWYEVLMDDSSFQGGDEPLQIKKKFPIARVVADEDRVEACERLCHPTDSSELPADYIVLDDAFQYRRLEADLKIVLIDYNHPVLTDMLLPLGRLRDLRERVRDADIIIVSKSPAGMEDIEKEEFVTEMVGLKDYDPAACTAMTPAGERKSVYFTRIEYGQCVPVFSVSNPRYIYSKKLVLFTGIARNIDLRNHMSDNYSIIRCFTFRDHHVFSRSDLRRILSVIKHHPTAALITTEKDAQRILDCKAVPEALKERMFYIPVSAVFTNRGEEENFKDRIFRP